MATVKVHLLTHRRNQLLPRAVESLLAQTHTDWICDLHNDAPDDPFPGELVKRLADPRIQLVQHNENLGINRSFNLVFQACPEADYLCLLEDDNWWEPVFLATMVKHLERNPSHDAAWCNMRVWREQAGGGWTDTGRLIWPANNFVAAPLWQFDWPHERHPDNIVHSNGALLLRSRSTVSLQTPSLMPAIAMEPARDRALPYPLLFEPRPLVNFAWTLGTGREQAPLLSAQMQALHTAAFLACLPSGSPLFAHYVDALRRREVYSLGSLPMLALLAGKSWQGLRCLRPREYPRVILSLLAHAKTNFKLLKARREHPEVWAYLHRCTRARFERCPAPLEFKQATPLANTS